MTDRELLELAAKAAGVRLGEWHGSGFWADTRNSPYGECAISWNPLTDDGDALRLAVRLHMCVECLHIGASVVYGNPCDPDEFDFVNETSDVEPRDLPAMTRRAIVRAAAELGKGQP